MQRRFVFALLASAALCETAGAQGVITTFAGTDWVFKGDGKPAVDAPLGVVSGIAVDPAGNVIVVDSSNCIVARITPDGTLRVIGGTSICGVSGDNGPATSASFGPNSVAIDRQGNLYLTTFSQIKKLSTAGILTTVAGQPNITTTGGPLGNGGPALNALVSTGSGGIAVSDSGAVFFADTSNHIVRKIDENGIIRIVAGNGANVSGFSPPQGIALETAITPEGIALDNSGNLYIAEPPFNRIRKVAGGIISTAVSNVVGAVSIAFDRAGDMYIGGRSAIYKVSPGASNPVLIAGSEQQQGFSGDGDLATAALFSGPLIVAPDNAGNLYICDKGNFRVRKIDRNGIVTTVAGNGQFRYGGEDVPALAAALNGVTSVVVDQAGNVYFSESNGHRVRKVASGIVTTYAGTGGAGFSGDGGPAAQASLSSPTALVVDRAGSLFIVDSGNNRIRKVTPDGIISTYTRLFGCRALAFDSAGTLYASSGDRIYTIDEGGNLKDVGLRDPMFNSVRLRIPSALALDSMGNLYIADSGDRLIRRVTPQGVVSTIAGNSGLGPPFEEGGPAVGKGIGNPYALAFDAAGNLYISTSFTFGRILKLTPSGTISTFAGADLSGDLGDGKVATAASVSSRSLAFDRAGNLFTAEFLRVRVILTTPPSIHVAPENLSFTASSGGAPVVQALTVQGSIPGLDFQVDVDTGSTANWLTAEGLLASTPRLLSITADPTNLAPGTYHATLTITPAAATPANLTVEVTFQVGAALPPQLSVDKPNLSFTFPKGAGARSEALKISNAGGGTLNFTATAGTQGGRNWLSVSPSSGAARPGSPATLTVTADPSTFGPGTYTGTITIRQTGGNGTASALVTMTVSSLTQALLLTQTGMSFQAVAQGGVVPPQSFGVVNLGAGVLSWSASTSTLSGGDWLRVTPARGASDASAPAPQVSVSVDAASLAPGNYYGLVRIAAPGAANTPHHVTVFLDVLRPDEDPGAVVQPTELIFSAVPGEVPPGARTLRVYGVGTASKTFSSGRSSPGFQIYSVPQGGSLDPDQPVVVIVQPAGLVRPTFPDFSGYSMQFDAGTYNGSLTFQFSDGHVQSVKITVISSPVAQNQPKTGEGRLASGDACVPTQLVPVVTTLGSYFAVSAGWPVALAAEVRDDCGNPHVSGSVTVRFSDGEAPIGLHSLNDGTWQGTWQTRSGSQSQVTVTVDAANPQLQIRGTREVSGEFRSLKDPPVFTQGSIVSSATAAPFQALAPGSQISIFGNRLAENNAAAVGLPLPFTLGDTPVRVIIADQIAPLQMVSQNQINLLVPFGLNVNTVHQVLVQRGLTYSQPIPVDVASAQPSIFPSGAYGMILASRNGGTPVQVSPTSPAQAGDALLIYCAGLGVTNPTPADGVPAAAPARTQNPVTVSIGGREARVESAALAPGVVGIYQINAVMPSGVMPGDSVPVTLTVAGQTGPPANLAVR